MIPSKYSRAQLDLSSLSFFRRPLILQHRTVDLTIRNSSRWPITTFCDGDGGVERGGGRRAGGEAQRGSGVRRWWRDGGDFEYEEDDS